MRLRLPLAVLLALLPTGVAFADDKSAADLVAAVVIGAADGATWAFAGGQIQGVLKETAPGTFEAPAANGAPAVLFTVTEKSKCVFDLVFSLDKQVQGGLELDATKMKTVTYSDAKPQTGWTDYAIAIDGAKGVTQNIGTDGALSETDPHSTLSTSIPQADLEADVKALQATYCPAAA